MHLNARPEVKPLSKKLENITLCLASCGRREYACYLSTSSTGPLYEDAILDPASDIVRDNQALRVRRAAALESESYGFAIDESVSGRIGTVRRA